MAAATSIILAGTALASTGLGVAKSVKEAKQAREAKKNIDNYQRQEIDFNNYLMAVDAPTDQYVQQLKRVQQESANYSEQASSAGARGLSLLPGIQEQTYAQEEQLAANFQNQLYELQKQQAIMAAEQESREFQARENREQRELAGYGALYEAGRQGRYAGMTEALGGVQAIAGIQAIAGMASGWNLGGGGTTTTMPPPPSQINLAGTVMNRNVATSSLVDMAGNSYGYNQGVGYTTIPQTQALKLPTYDYKKI